MVWQISSSTIDNTETALTKKTYSINCGKRCDELLERISEEVPGAFSASIEGGILRITFDNSYIGVRETIEAIKDIARSLAHAQRPRGPGMRVSVKQIQKRMGGSAHIDPLIEVLKLRGYRVSASGGYIETDAPIEEVIDLASAVAGCAEESPKETLTPQARRAIIALCAHHGVGADHLVRVLEDQGILKREPDGRLGMSKPVEDIKDIVSQNPGG